jgi:multidrug resistance protein, MATE family
MSIPLILSTSAWSIQHFVDRMFLTWYSPEAVAAAMPAGLVNFAVSTIFAGTAGYVNTFVAQYHGAGRPERIGPSLWQGLYVALIGGVFLMALAPLAEPLFTFIGHEPAVREGEIAFFQILSLGSVFPLAAGALSSFFSGRGENWPVTWVNFLATAVNCLFNWLLTFGNAGFPRLGIRGSAIATVIAGFVAFAAFALLAFRPANDRRYLTLRGWRLDSALFARLIRFGLPSGVQFFLDVAGFTAFLLMIGRLGTAELAATNIAFNVNTLAFMPMIGCGIAVSVLVGQYLGENEPDLAERSAYSGFHVTMLYMSAIALAYVLIPGVFIAPYAAHADAGSFAVIAETVRVLLRFVALYSIFDTMTIVFSSAVKGAGDTRFVMVVIGGVSIGVLVVPSYVALITFGAGLDVGWIIVTTYIIALGFAFYLRFASGRWRSMRVIEPHLLPEASPGASAAPAGRTEP